MTNNNIKSLFYEEGCCPTQSKLCVRRVCGVIGFLCFIVGIFMKLDQNLMYLLGIGSFSLLGLTTFDKNNKTE